MTPAPPRSSGVPWHPRLAGLVLLGHLLGPVPGCTASKAQLEILSAEEALRRADGYNAERLATYEYVMASEYLGKAREEAGFSAYRVADTLARRSAQWSDRAIISVERHGRAEFDLEDLTDRVPAPDLTGPTSPDPGPADPEPDEDRIGDLDDELDLDSDGGSPP